MHQHFEMKHFFRVLSVSIVAILFAFIGHAQIPLSPQIPDHKYTVTDFGALGDGTLLNTKAIQAALNKAAIAGGVVVIPKGVFLCGPLVLSSKTNLVLEKGAVLKLRNDIDSFPVENERYLNFINAKNATDIKIRGEGTIDGQGQIWWDKYTDKQIVFRRPQMLYIEHCERLEIAGVTFLNPPNTHVSLKDCAEVYIHDITIQAPEKSRNTDGLNISVKNCLIEACTINTGDDNIAINFGGKDYTSANPECENITIRNCKFGYGHGLSIGSYTSGHLRNLNVTNCVFDGTTSAIRIKTARGRGGVVEQVSYKDIKISNSKWPIFISEYYPKEPADPADDTAQAITNTTPAYKNIVLKNVFVTNSGEAIKVWGLPESPIKGIRFINVMIDAKKGMQFYNVKDVSFKNSVINVAEGERLKTFNAEVQGL